MLARPPNSRKAPVQRGLIFAGVLLLAGVAAYLLFSQGGTGPAEDVGATTPEVSSAGLDQAPPGHPGTRSETGASGKVEALGSQITELAKAVDSLRREVSSLRADAAWSRDAADPSQWSDEQAFTPIPPTQTQAESFQSALDAEKGQSKWGRQMQSTVESTFADRIDQSPVFSAYGGTLESTCKQTVCRFSWGASELSAMEEADRDDLLERARWDLMAVVGQSGASGQIAFVSGQREDGSPEMTVLIKQDGGGSNQETPTKN